MGEDGHGCCRTYGSGVPRNFVYPQSSTLMEARLNSLENKERNHNGQVLDASSGYETDRRESIGEQPNSPSSPSQLITGGSKQVYDTSPQAPLQYVLNLFCLKCCWISC
ncbi:hypothetical protein ACLB2K_004141 [Fragaria x ananassa]